MSIFILMFRCEKSRKAPVTVFYPVDKAEYDKFKHKSSRNVSRTPKGVWTAYGISKGIVGISSLFKYFKEERIQALNNHPMHTDFADNKQKLRPVLFSPGLVFGRTGYSGICRELASHGMMVYAIDHTDNSCPFYEDVTQEPPAAVYYTDYDQIRDTCSLEGYRQRQMSDRSVQLIHYLG